MTEPQWEILVYTPGAMARHQALELLRLERDPWEWTLPEVVQMHRWAIAVLSSVPSPLRSA